MRKEDIELIATLARYGVPNEEIEKILARSTPIESKAEIPQDVPKSVSSESLPANNSPKRTSRASRYMFPEDIDEARQTASDFGYKILSFHKYSTQMQSVCDKGHERTLPRFSAIKKECPFCRLEREKLDLKQIQVPTKIEIFDSDALDEFHKISSSAGDFGAMASTNDIVLKFQPHFYNESIKILLDEELKEKLLINRMRHADLYPTEATARQLLRGTKICRTTDGFSHYSPFWIKAFIEKYDVKSIYDPCMGWGQRNIGAHDIKYVGNDACQETFNGNIEIAKFLKLENRTFYNEDSSEFSVEHGCEAVYTCPPYFNTEIYDGDKTSTSKYPIYKDWLEIWWSNTVKNAIKPSVRLFAFQISKKYADDMKEVCEKNGLKLIETILVGAEFSKRSHFTPNGKAENRERLLVFSL